jgi:hypothetical protein
MAIRHLLLAALVSSAFSAHAGPTIYGSTGNGTVLLATSATGQVQTYMPRAVEGFFLYKAPTASVTAPVLLPESGQSTVPPASVELIRPAPDVIQAPAPGAGTAPEAQVAAPAEVNLADLVKVGISTDIVAQLPPADVSAGPTVDAIAPTVLLPLLDATAVPEPATSGLMLAGLAGVGLMARRRRSR